jgi:hypothetical protein
MKNARSQTLRTSHQEITKNPTSTGTTVWEYAVLLYLVLNYILQDSPRHVQYREKATQDQKSSSSTKHSQKPSTSSRYQSDVEFTTGDSLSKDSQATTINQSYPQPGGQSRNSHRNDQAYPSKCDIRNSNHDISRAQMREAWARIRAVSKVSSNPTDTHSKRNEGNKRAKKVRWGVVQTRQFESATDATDEDTTNQHESRHDQKRARRSPEDRGNGTRKEPWPSVEKEGEHEIWGPTEGSHGQFE